MSRLVDKNEIKRIIDNYRKSGIQSEAEIRSKLLVPLIEALGFPAENRAEEFPVHSWSGGTKQRAKPADFLLFSDKDYANKGKATQFCINWVQDHSLLVCEAKMLNKMPDVEGQTRFYTMWTKAPAYITCDGISIRGSFFNQLTSDTEYINCAIEQLPECLELDKFSFDNLVSLKKALLNRSNDNTALNTIASSSLLPEDIQLPASTASFIRDALRLPANLSDHTLLSRFIQYTNTILDCEIRYDVPEYIYDIPRRVYKAELFIDGDSTPIYSGEVVHYYRNDNDLFCFQNDSFLLVVEYYKTTPIKYFINYSATQQTASERLDILISAKKVLTAKNAKLVIDTLGTKELRIRSSKKRYHPSYSDELKLLEYWIAEMEKIKVIEETYGVHICLKQIDSDSVESLYAAVDIVYNGIVYENNCHILSPIEAIPEDGLIIEEPTLFEEINLNDATLQTQTIHNITFIPWKSFFLPNTILRRQATNGFVEVPLSVVFRVYNSNSL